MSKKIAGLITLSLLFAMVLIAPASAAIQRYAQPRFDDAYMQIITDPDAEKVAFQTCQIEMLPDLIRWDIVTKLQGEGNTIVASPGFHFCYLCPNCRDYVPDDYGQPDAGRHLEPLNFTAFRLAMAWAGLSRAQKEQAILEIYGGPVVTACDTVVPPSLGVWNDPTVSPPGGSNETAYQKLITEGGFYVSGGHLYQPNGIQVRTPIEVLSPSAAPTSVAFTGRWCDAWNKFFMDYLGTDVQFVNTPVATSTIIQRAQWYRNFDVYFLCWGLGQFPDYLYDFFHSSQEGPGEYNRPGIKDAILDKYLEYVKYGLDYETKIDNCYAAQHRIVEQLIAYFPIYSRTYFTAFKNYMYYTSEDRKLVNMVNMRGVGADNGWTWGLMHWNTAPTGGTLKYCLTGNLENLHPGWAVWAYEWDVLNRLFDGLIASSPMLEDMPWIACKWWVESFNDPSLGIVNGTKVTFQIRSDVKWHDGVPVTVEDIIFALGINKNTGFIRNYPKWSSIYEYLAYSERVDPCTVSVFMNITSQWILYDLAGVALLFPKHIYGPGGWLETHGYNPVNAPVWEIPYGVGGCPTALVGNGPYMFDWWNPAQNLVHIIKNPHYWVDGPIKQNFIAPQRVDPCQTFQYYVELVNTGSKDDVTGELVPMVIDWIDITVDGEIVDTLLGPFVIDPFGVLVLGPFDYHFATPGYHYLDCHTWAYGEMYDSYIHPIWVTIIEDTNFDFTVNFLDAIILGAAFGSKPGDPNWDARADIKHDRFINFLDAIKLGAVFGWPS